MLPTIFGHITIENYRNANGDGLHRIVPVSFAYARQGVIDNTEGIMAPGRSAIE